MALIDSILVDGSHVSKNELRNYLAAQEVVSVKDPAFGAVGDGVTDDTDAIDAAIASGGAKTVHFPAGQYVYTGQLIKPDGVSLSGDGMNATAINITYAGYGVRIDGVGGVIRDMQINCSQDGVKFYADPNGSASYTLFNTLYRVDLVGPGRAATFAARSTHGVIFDPYPPNNSAVFFNALNECRIRQFDIGVTFDGQTGAASSGGNANHAINCQIEGYWIAYNVRSIENDIRGGFLHAASGNSNSEYTIGYYLENGCSYNYIEPAVGEPGNYAQCFTATADTFANTIGAGAANYPIGSIQGGDNNVIGWNGATALSLTENHYYRAQITRAFTNYTGGAFVIRWASNVTGLSGASGGRAEILAYKDGSTVRCAVQNYSQTGTGRSVNLVGIYVNASNELEAVFYVDNNGTSTSAANLVYNVEGVGNVASVVHVNSLTDAGTTNPATYNVLRASATWNPASIANNVATSTTISVPGAAVGDYVEVAHTAVAQVGLMLTGLVTAADTVGVTLANMTGGTVDVASGTLTVQCRKI